MESCLNEISSVKILKNRLKRLSIDKFNHHYTKQVDGLIEFMSKYRTMHQKQNLKRISVQVFNENKDYVISNVKDVAIVVNQNIKSRIQLNHWFNTLFMNSYQSKRNNILIELVNLAKSYCILKIKWKVV